MRNVLILDGHQRSALAATRALGAQGVAVYVGEIAADNLAANSKYCARSIELPDPVTAPDDYVLAIKSALQEHEISTLFPMTDISTACILKNASLFSNIALPLPSYEAYLSMTNKSNLFKIAQDQNIPIPVTVHIESIAQLNEIIDTLTYPLVIKPALSRILHDGAWISTHVSIVQSRQELLALISNHDWLQNYPFMLQEFIPGHGAGIFALFSHGAPVCYFAHKRLREKPPEGGISVLCESADVPDDMRKFTEKLLTSVGWNGVAMVEFRVTNDGTPYLMEVNGRFWGSLQLAIDAGVNFPYLAYQLANREKLPDSISYTTGVRSRWLLGDLDRLYLVFKNRSGKYSPSEKIKNCANFLRLFQKNTNYEINRLDDMKPFLFELKAYIKALG